MARRAWAQRGGSDESEQDGATARSGAVAAPAGQDAAPPGRPPTAPANPQALNRYAYALNNPLQYVDPTGHWTISVNVGAEIFSGQGVRGNLGLAIDTQGNIAVLLIDGVSSHTNIGARACYALRRYTRSAFRTTRTPSPRDVSDAER